jgi:hypothetical protein
MEHGECETQCAFLLLPGRKDNFGAGILIGSCHILTNKEIYARVKKSSTTETIRLDYTGLGMYREWKKIPKSIIYEFENKIER